MAGACSRSSTRWPRGYGKSRREWCSRCAGVFFRGGAVGGGGGRSGLGNDFSGLLSYLYEGDLEPGLEVEGEGRRGRIARTGAGQATTTQKTSSPDSPALVSTSETRAKNVVVNYMIKYR
jgi:hypothetical protein